MRRRYSVTPRFFTAAFVTLLAISCIFLWVMYGVYRDAADEHVRLNNEHNELILRSYSLRDEIDFAKSDEYIMRAARSRLGMVRDDELAYVNTH